jgi:hypothetical protein
MSKMKKRRLKPRRQVASGGSVEVRTRKAEGLKKLLEQWKRSGAVEEEGGAVQT